jgi:hypothetical protein
MEHWKECSSCQHDFADADYRLLAFRQDLASGTRETVRRSRNSYFAAKYQAALADTEHAAIQILAHLAIAGWQLGEELWSVNTGGTPFQNFVLVSSSFDEDEDNDETLRVNYGVFDFFASLPAEDKHFVAAANTAYSLLGNPPFPDSETDVSEWDEEDWHEHRTQAYEQNVKESGLCAPTLLRLLELAAPAIAEDYQRRSYDFLTRHSKQADSAPVSRQNSVVIRSALDGLRGELLHDFENLSDSMKATQMELLRTIEKGGQAADPDPFLIQVLGKELFSHLHPETQEFLRAAERLHRSANTVNAERAAAMLLALAYEKEFHVRVTQMLAMSLIHKGYSDYPPKDDIKLIRERQANKRITPAQMLQIIEKDEQAQKQLRSLSIDWNQLLDTGKPTTDLRNRVMHPEAFDVAKVQRIRELILDGEKGALRALMPRSPISQS